MSDFYPHAFSTRRSELKFWNTVADVIFDGYPWYHMAIPRRCCAVCRYTIQLGFFAEDKIIELKEQISGQQSRD